MDDGLASANVNRSYSLSATTIAIFTFTLVFLYPRLATGEANPVLFQLTLGVMGVATFSFVGASFLYYGVSLGARVDSPDRIRLGRRGDRLWLLGTSLLTLAPSLILFTVNLIAVGVVWFTLWLVYVVLAIRFFPRVQTTTS